jgi:ABC-2 type transport system permease protein
MTVTLVRKLLRDLRTSLIGIALLLGLFQVFWYRITDRIIGEMSPFFTSLASVAGLTREDIEARLFAGPARVMRSFIGGERVNLDTVMDLLSVGYVHPLMQTVFCIWAVGRAAGAIAGELDRGTMELLMAQPLARYRLLLAHLLVDFLTIPVLCLALWAGTSLGHLLIGPIQLRPVEGIKPPVSDSSFVLKLGPLQLARMKDPTPGVVARLRTEEEKQAATAHRLEVRLVDFGPGLLLVGGLIFAVSGYTMALSASGRFRWRVLGLAVFVTLIQFLVNLLGQMWDFVEPLRPLTVFYYYQPQQLILGSGWEAWTVPVYGWRVPHLAVLAAVGMVGYGVALWIFTRRDLPAPL